MPKVSISLLKPHLYSIPRPRILTDWYDEGTAYVLLEISNGISDAVVGVDFAITDPPEWLARWIDSRSRRYTKAA